MTSSIDRESIIERVQKLLALAGNNNNVNEAAAAMARAQRLMLEHKLAAAELATQMDDADDEIGVIAVDEVGDFLLAWKPLLMSSVARASCCRAVEYKVVTPDGRKGVRFKVIGTESDASYVAYVYRYLCAEIDRLCDLEAKGKGFGFRNSFRRGAVDTIGSRLHRERAQVVKDQADSGKALAILSKSSDAVDAYIKQKFGKLRSSSTSAPGNSFGYGAGRKAGEKIAIPGQDRRGAIGKAPAQLRPEPKKIRG